MPLDRVESLTFYETTGPRGVMNSQPHSLAPEATQASNGDIFPVYNVFEALAGIRHLLSVSISDQTLVTAFAFQNDQERSIALIANPTAEPKAVELQVVDLALNKLSIDETNVSRASPGGLTVTQVGSSRGHVKLHLAPHALLKLQFG